jgi:hypothetical protein
MKYILIFLSLVFLIIAVLFEPPYGFYTMLRFVVTIYCGYVAYTFYKMSEGKNYLYVLFGLLAILFNPIVPIHLDRETWQIIDGGMVIMSFIPFLFKAYRNKDKF